MEVEIFYVGIFVTILLLIGIIINIIEFRKMGKNPNDYRDSYSYKKRK